MSVNTDPRIRAAEALKHAVQKVEPLLIRYQKHIMWHKLKPVFKEGQRVTVTIRDIKYVGTVLENRRTIYTTGENGFLEVVCKWDNPAPHWRNGVFSFNQIHLTAL